MEKHKRYVHTYINSELISFGLTIWWDGTSIFKIQSKLQVTQNLLVFCKKCKQFFRVIDETLEFDWLSKKEDEEVIAIQDYGILISHWQKTLCNHDNS